MKLEPIKVAELCEFQPERNLASVFVCVCIRVWERVRKTQNVIRVKRQGRKVHFLWVCFSLVRATVLVLARNNSKV